MCQVVNVGHLTPKLSLKRMNRMTDLYYHREKGTQTFIFCFEETARQFASFLKEQGVKFRWIINLDLCQNEIDIISKETHA